MSAHCNDVLITVYIYRDDEQWKELRTAVGKQTLPRNVNSYIPGMNDVLQRFTRYLRANRDEKGYVEDISDLLNKLLMECKLCALLWF